MKRLLIFILIGLISGLLFVLYFDYYLKPDNKFFVAAANKGDSWTQKLRAESTEPCYVITGGSEIRMGINPAIILQDSGTRLLNAAGQAGFGYRCNIVHALNYLQPGDTLIINVRSTVFDHHKTIPNGLKYCWQRMGTKTFSSDLIPPTIDNIAKLLQGSSAEISLFIIKMLATPDSIYKYDSQTIIHETGWIENQYKTQLPKPPVANGDLSEALSISVETKEFLNTVKKECDKRGAKLCTYFYAAYADQSYYPHAVATALTLTRHGIPVVRDEVMGLDSSEDSFADTPLHLSPEGSRTHSIRLGRILSSEQKFWTEAELVDKLHSMGYNDSGVKLPLTSSPAGK